MTPIGIVLLSIYGIGAIPAFRVGFRVGAEPTSPKPVDYDELLSGALLGFIAVIGWPAILAVYLLYKAIESMGGPDTVARKVGGETKEQKLERQDKRIDELEKELALGPYSTNDS